MFGPNVIGVLAIVVGTTIVSAALDCQSCRAPKFQGRNFYLPFCTTDKDGLNTTHANICEAVCADFDKFSQGSCGLCEKKCPAVFLPVCSPDQTTLYANKCRALCALDGDKSKFVECQGLQMIIPGRSKLPPNRLLPKKIRGDFEATNQIVDKEEEE